MTNLTTHGQDPLAMLAWYVEAGVDEAILEEPLDRFALSKSATKTDTTPTAPAQESTSKRPAVLKPVTAQAALPTASLADAETAASAANSLEELHRALEEFDGGPLKDTASNCVFADGTEGAPLMVIGAAPGAAEDKAGKPFQGDEGALLDKMLAAINFSRADNAYLTTLLPWRPLGGRRPDAETSALYLPFLKRHIELAAPKALLIMGGSVAHQLFEEEATISKLRGHWHTLKFSSHEVDAIATYQPAYLMQQPRFKADAWADLLSLKAKLSDG